MIPTLVSLQLLFAVLVAPATAAANEFPTSKAPQPRAGVQVRPTPETKAVSEMVRVPDVTKRTLVGARAALAEKNLQPGREIARPAAGQRAGSVVAQEPEAGSLVRPGTRVTLWVATAEASEGKKPTPDAPSSGTRDDGARRSTPPRGSRPFPFPIPDVGVTFPSRPLPPAPVPPAPPVQTEPALVPVPKVTAQTVSQAAATLGRVGLAVGEERRQESDRPEGTVIEQKPTPWTLVPANTRVDVVVAVPALVAVPDLSEQVVKQAVTTLHGVGLELGGQQREESERSVGTVIDQTPSPGKRVERGTRVNVIVAAPRLIIVPDLTQLAVRQATATLDGVGLALGGERRQESERSAGTVIDQTPPPGKRVERGTRVEVVVAVAALVRVPDVTDQMVREAAETVQGARLVLGDQSRRPSRRPAGTVLEQRPSAGEMVARGATVHVVVAETPPAPPVASAPPAPTPPAPPRPLGPVGSDTTSPDPRPTPAPPTRPAPPASAVPDAPTPERLPTPAAPLSAPPPAAPATPVTPPAASAARPAPFPFWVASLAAFLLGAASMLTYRLVRKRMSRRSHSPVTPSVRFQLRQDAGTQEIAAGAVARRDRAVRLAVRLDPGQQTVWDQLVAEPRGERA